MQDVFFALLFVFLFWTGAALTRWCDRLAEEAPDD